MPLPCNPQKPDQPVEEKACALAAHHPIHAENSTQPFRCREAIALSVAVAATVQAAGLPLGAGPDGDAICHLAKPRVLYRPADPRAPP